MKRFEHTVVVERPIKDVYALAKHVERYPEFLPGYLESRIIGRRDGALLLERKALVQGRVHAWQSEVRFQDDAAIDFRHSAGALEGMSVRWLFTSLSPRRTQVSITHLFSLTARSRWRRTVIPLVMGPRVKRIAGDVIHAFRDACESGRWSLS